MLIIVEISRLCRTGRLHFANILSTDSLSDNRLYLCAYYNPAVRAMVKGNDHKIIPYGPGIARQLKICSVGRAMIICAIFWVSLVRIVSCHWHLPFFSRSSLTNLHRLLTIHAIDWSMDELKDPLLFYDKNLNFLLSIVQNPIILGLL